MNLSPFFILMLISFPGHARADEYLEQSCLKRIVADYELAADSASILKTLDLDKDATGKAKQKELRKKFPELATKAMIDKSVDKIFFHFIADQALAVQKSKSIEETTNSLMNLKKKALADLSKEKSNPMPECEKWAVSLGQAAQACDSGIGKAKSDCEDKAVKSAMDGHSKFVPGFEYYFHLHNELKATEVTLPMFRAIDSSKKK